MRQTSLARTLIFAGALAMSAGPALAQRGGGGGRVGGGGGGGHMGGSHIGGGPMGGGGHVGGMRGGSPTMGSGMRMGGPVPRAPGTVHGGAWNGGAWNGGAWHGGGWHSGASHAVWHGDPWHGGTWHGGSLYGGPWHGGYWGGGRYWGGRYWNVAPIRYYYPYYTFQRYFSVGYGLWAGYPVPWVYPYYYPYPSSGHSHSESDVTAVPGYTSSPDTTITSSDNSTEQSNIGGLSFEITPSDAQIYIDDQLVGTVGQFTPTSQPLGVPAGRHHIEVRRAGYETMSFDADVVAGQVIPYQGQMEH